MNILELHAHMKVICNLNYL